jgi:hypothetical protein
MLTRGFRRIVWLLKLMTPSAGAGADAQVPTQPSSLGMTILAFSHNSCRGGLELLAAVEVTHTSYAERSAARAARHDGSIISSYAQFFAVDVRICPLGTLIERRSMSANCQKLTFI